MSLDRPPVTPHPAGPARPGVSPRTSSSPDDRAARVRFRRAITLMLLTLVAPGSAQLLAGNRQVGRVALRIWVGLLVVVAALLLTGLVWHGMVFELASDVLVLGVVRFVLMALAVGWATLFMDAWRLGDPLSLRQPQRVAAVGVNGLLCFSVAGTLLFGAHVVGVQRELMSSMFTNGEATAATAGRYNVLLMGGDSGEGRVGLRPDSMTVASIDAETGRTVLISLPRNMQNFHFRDGSTMDKQFPEGWTCDDCYLNAVSTWATDNAGVFKKSKNPGIDATIDAIEGITDLRINYWAMVNMAGFTELVDAVGGVELNVRDRIPVGGLGDDVVGYIEPGVRTLDGHDTLWFARAREGSDDYSRMARQKCVMSAMLDQVSPQSALRNFSDIAKASSAMISTDVPGSEVGTFAQLALKARSEPISTVSLVPPLINTADPDIELIQNRIANAIDRAEGKEAPKPSRKRTRTPADMTGGSLGNMSDGYAANQAEDLGATC
ncbi:LCP family protein [Nocardioides sp. CFH 31398]|uniref:LCP family protein n=1 Tax=Nocardioides sp. CFH 31398 TaxID=2919579 RepID=UPI001F056CDF|nr:LCP family protein [Nocardioides sp. CFH 31398]MCH1866425.1 LCP family protein [Nocardioides sp. CFH 31398]